METVVIAARNPQVRATASGDAVMIDRSEFFWQWPTNLSERQPDVDAFVASRFPVGSVQQVFWMSYSFEWKEFIGSLRRARPQDNVYAHLLASGKTQFNARVTRSVGFGGGRQHTITVCLENGRLATIGEGHVRPSQHLQQSGMGARLKVELELVDAWTPKLWVKPV